MDFEQEFLADILTCPKCHEKYIDPRILPWGETVCNKCVEFDEKSDGKDREYTSMVNLPQNKAIQKLLDKEEQKVKESTPVNDLKKLLNDMKQSLDNLISNQNSVEVNLKEQSSQLRHDIYKSTKNLIDEITNQEEKLLSQVILYENNCLKPMKSELNDILLESVKFKNEWNEYLNSQVVKESDILSATESGYKLFGKLKNEIKKLKLDEKLAFFRPGKIELNAIGKIEYLPKKKFFEMHDFKKIDLKDKLNKIDRAYFDKICVQCFDDNDYIFSFPTNPYNVKLILLRHDNVLKEYEIVQPVNKFKKTIHKNRIFLFLGYTQKLRTLDKNFLFLDEVDVGHEILSLAATNDYLYCLTDKSTVLEYNHRLRLTKRIKVNKETLDDIFVTEKKLTQLKA